MQIRACAYVFLALGMCLASVTHAEDLDDEDDDESEEQEQEQGDTKAPAPAAESTDGVHPLSVGLLLGYGFELRTGTKFGFDRTTDYNLWGLGLGVRGGYNFGRIYLGGRFIYHFGSDHQDYAPQTNRLYRDFSWHHWDLGVEGGYDVPLIDQLSLRPEFVLGMAGLTGNFNDIGNQRENSISNVYAYFALGSALIYDVAPTVFLGADLQLQIVVGGGATEALVFMAHGGMRF